MAEIQRVLDEAVRQSEAAGREAEEAALYVALIDCCLIHDCRYIEPPRTTTEFLLSV